MYPQAQATKPAGLPSTSMVSDTARLNAELSEVLHRVSKIGDTLHGPEPRESASGGVPEPVPTVRRNLDHAFDAVSRIHSELTRIENRL